MLEQTFEKKIKGIWIDPLIFTHKFVKACDVCICSGECCYYGVYTDYAEYENIMKMKKRIINSMDDSQSKDPKTWFEKPEEDEDFDSGWAVGTEVHNGKCVFLDQKGFCTLQKIAIDEGKNKWKYKPLYCILFPLVIYEGALTVDDDHLNRLHYCNKPENQNSTVYDCCQEELQHLLGEKGFSELKKYREEYLKKNGEN